MLKSQPAEWWPLHLVCTDPKSCIAQGGADANAEDAGGQKAIHAAAAEQHRDIVELLLPQTTPDDDNAADWTVDGVIQEAQQSIADNQPDQQQHQVWLGIVWYALQHVNETVQECGNDGVCMRW